MQQWAEIGRFVIIMYLINSSVDTEPFSKHVKLFSILCLYNFFIFLFLFQKLYSMIPPTKSNISI